MTLDSFETIMRALNDADVRYLVAGGMAVVAHGYPRFTADVDLVVAFDPENIAAFFDALNSLGYRPTVPVTARQLADRETRERWIAEKGMMVLNLFSDEHRETPVEVFVDIPFDFDEEYPQAFQGEIAPGVDARFVSIETLIEMKRQAGRPQDDEDIRNLDWIREERQSYEA